MPYLYSNQLLVAVNQRWLWFAACWRFTEFSFLNRDVLWPYEWNSTAGELYIQAAPCPPFLQHIHLGHVVPAALEVQGAHQALFLLCVLGTKAKRFKSFSAVSKGERKQKTKNKGNDLDSAWAGRDSSECLSWLKSHKDNHAKIRGEIDSGQTRWFSYLRSVSFLILTKEIVCGGASLYSIFLSLRDAKLGTQPLAIVNGEVVHGWACAPG